jgi:hypothetical protein
VYRPTRNNGVWGTRKTCAKGKQIPRGFDNGKDGHAATLHLRGARQEQLKSPAFAPQRKPSLRAKKKPQRLGYK